MKLRCLALFLAGWFWVPPLWGHVVLADGTIGVTMHVDPDDAPVSGKPSHFSLWFKDTTGRLDPARCQGTFTVALNDQAILSQPLFAQIDTGLISVHDVTFPRSGVYTVRINGAPRGLMTFQPFLLVFSVRVTGGEDGDQTADPGLLGWVADHGTTLGLGATAGVVILWWGLRPRRPRKKVP